VAQQKSFLMMMMFLQFGSSVFPFAVHILMTYAPQSSSPVFAGLPSGIFGLRSSSKRAF
jgi:hypothetical protein